MLTTIVMCVINVGVNINITKIKHIYAVDIYFLKTIYDTSGTAYSI